MRDQRAVPTAAPRKQPGASAAGAPGGFPFGDITQMQELIKYIPLLVKIARQAPGVLVGFFATIFYVLCISGRCSFRDYTAPVGGYHIFALFLARELYPLYTIGRDRAAALRQRREAQKSFHGDIAMQYREKLD